YTGKDLVWDFKKSFTDERPSLVRAMAAEFSLTALVTSDVSVLRLKDLSSGQVQLVPLNPVAGEVVVGVNNLCGDCEDKGGPLEDFAWFYRLVKSPGTISLPYRQAGGGLTDTYC